MGSLHRIPPHGGSFSRRFTGFSGLYFDEMAADSAWIRESAVMRLPPLEQAMHLVVKGYWLAHPQARGSEAALPGLTAQLNDGPSQALPPAAPGPWELRLSIPPAAHAQGAQLRLTLQGVAATNTLAWAGRITGLSGLQRFRDQKKNRQLRVSTIETDSGEVIFDFAQRDSPYAAAFARRHTKLGMNVVGFITADLGIGESARCMVKAADAAQIPISVVPLKLNCRNRLGDLSYADRLTGENPQPVNVIHVDPPASRDIDHHHGRAFRKGKYNIGYFAWELPEFPDSWTGSFDYFDEIWCPSDFARDAIAAKSPIPVLTMPHAVAFARPTESAAALRKRFGLPEERFLFLALFDLNSYAERKNPKAALEAFRRAALPNAGLVIKVHNTEANPGEFALLHQLVEAIPGAILLPGTFSRSDVYALESCVDAFVSLHRSEGFGFAIAECMYLGKPVLSTDWSASAEFVDASNGLPVPARLVELTTSHGPYAKGSVWAEADVEAAAQGMIRLAQDPALASRLGAAARRTMEERYSPQAIGQRYRRRLESIACF